MEWAGQDIGQIDVIEQPDCVWFNYGGLTHAALVKARVDPSLCCLFDEMKPLFGLDKVGTVRALVDGKRVVLYRCLTDQLGNLITPPPLSQPTDELKPYLRRCLLYRDAVGITTYRHNQFRVWDGRVLSWDEVTLDKTAPDSSIYTSRLGELRRWAFDNYRLELRDELGVSSSEQLNELLFQLRSELEALVERVDRDKIWLVDRICRRIQMLVT